MSQTEDYIRETQAERIPLGALAKLVLQMARGLLAKLRAKKEESRDGQ